MRRTLWNGFLGVRCRGTPSSGGLWCIGVVAVLVLAVVAAAGLAATNGAGNAVPPTPNGCPTNKSAKTARVAQEGGGGGGGGGGGSCEHGEAAGVAPETATFDVLAGSVNIDGRLHVEGAGRGAPVA